jgi:serine/threonine-protein kinase HipA
VTVRAADERVLPPAAEGVVPGGEEPALRFSLAGVQLKFSAIEETQGGLTIPATGDGGSWIVKLPSARFAGVAENEFAMMTLAGMVGIEVPAIRLLDVEDIGGLPAGVGRLEGKAYAVQRFDRVPGGGRVHMEDFAQVLGVYPEAKYRKATYSLLAKILWLETGEAGVTEFIRWLVFSALTGNADMHLKNWSLLYRDGVTPTLSPAYDFVSTLAYIPDNEAALKFARTKRWDGFGVDELRFLAARAGAPEELVVRTARETVLRFREVWGRRLVPVGPEIADVVERQMDSLPLASL